MPFSATLHALQLSIALGLVVLPDAMGMVGSSAARSHGTRAYDNLTSPRTVWPWLLEEFGGVGAALPRLPGPQLLLLPLSLSLRLSSQHRGARHSTVLMLLVLVLLEQLWL